MPKLQKNSVTGQFSLGLPLAIIQGLGWQPGTDIQIRIAGKDRLELCREAPKPQNPVA